MSYNFYRDKDVSPWYDLQESGIVEIPKQRPIQATVISSCTIHETIPEGYIALAYAIVYGECAFENLLKSKYWKGQMKHERN